MVSNPEVETTPARIVARVDMREALRFDAGELRKPEETQQGFLRVDGYVSRPGIYEYVNTPDDEADGLGKAGSIRRELRPDDEVFRVDALAGFEGVPVTMGHPKKHVDITNVKALEVGSGVRAGERADGDRIATSMVIKDPKAIARLKSRKSLQLSPGYKIREDHTPGVDPKYGRYDLVQRDIKINHLALVDRARGGSDLAIRMDGMTVGVERSDDWDDVSSVEPVVMTTSVEGHQHTLDPADASGRTSYATADGADDSHCHEWIRGVDGAITIADNAGHTHEIDPSTLGLRSDENRSDAADARRGDTAMKTEEQIGLLKVRADEAEKIAAERKDALDVAVSRADAAEAALKTSKERVAELDARIAAGSAAIETKAVKEQAERADRAERALEDLKKKQPEMIATRCDAIVKARAVLGDVYRSDGKTDRAIRVDVIKQLRPKEDVSDQVSDAAIASRFDSLIEDRTRAARSLTSIGEALGDEGRQRADSNDRGGNSKVSTRDSRAKEWANQALLQGPNAPRRTQES